MSARPAPQGWCPNAYRPMVSGDGLLCRVKPRLSRMTAAQVFGLCAAARRYGNGFIDLTARANLQVRGVTDHGALLEALKALGLLSRSPGEEERRNIVITPDWRANDVATRLYARLENALPDLPPLPDKFGFVIDTGPSPVLQDVSGDIRVERLGDTLLLRADGSDQGLALPETEIMPALIDLLGWFVDSGGPAERRMARHLANVTLPDRFRGAVKPASGPPLEPGGPLYGLRFGQTRAEDLERLMELTEARALRATPWRLLLLEDARRTVDTGFVRDPADPARRVFSCSGAPACARASGPTRALADILAAKLPPEMTLHVSGCAKGCAHPRKADLTLVATERGFDLVEAGVAWDEPSRTGLSPADPEMLIPR